VCFYVFSIGLPIGSRVFLRVFAVFLRVFRWSADLFYVFLRVFDRTPIESRVFLRVFDRASDRVPCVFTCFR